LIELTAAMRNWLSEAGVDAYRAVDDPRPGENIRERISDGIANAHGTVLFWSKLGSKSKWVRWEYEEAKSLDKPVCMIRFPDARIPRDWNLDVEWVDLRGVLYRARASPRIGQGMMDKIRIFATRARDRE
jgi:hypothetical protein